MHWLCRHSVFGVCGGFLAWNATSHSCLRLPGRKRQGNTEATLHSPARSGSLGHSTTVHDSLEVGSSTAAYGTVPHSGRHTMASEMQYSAKLNALRGARLSPQARAVLYIVGSVATILPAGRLPRGPQWRCKLPAHQCDVCKQATLAKEASGLNFQAGQRRRP